jgi:hypothetical protein
MHRTARSSDSTGLLGARSPALVGQILVTMGPQGRKILGEQVGRASTRHPQISKKIVKIVRQVGSDEIALASSGKHLVGPLEDSRDFSLHISHDGQIQLSPKTLRQPMRADLRRQLTGGRGRIADESEARFLRGQDVSIEPEMTAPLDRGQRSASRNVKR